MSFIGLGDSFTKKINEEVVKNIVFTRFRKNKNICISFWFRASRNCGISSTIYVVGKPYGLSTQ